MTIKTRQLAINLKIRRAQFDLSQEDLAIKSKLKLSNVSKLEGGFNLNPTLATLVALAEVLTNGSIDKLLNISPPKKKPIKWVG